MMHVYILIIFLQSNNKTRKMPPKPWLAKTGPARQDVSAIIQSNPTMKQQIPKLSMQQPMMGPSTVEQALGGATTQNTNIAGMTGALGNGLGTTTGLGTSGYGSYGSSYGGYGGGYGSGYGGSMYGSSYGGGYGSSYGMGGGYGSYGMGMGGGYGRMGMMGGDQNQKGFIMNTLVALQSLGFLIGSFCQIGRSLDQNIQGLGLFYNSFKNLFKKMFNGIKDGFEWLGQKTKKSVLAVLDFIKTYILFMKHEDPKNKLRSLSLIIKISVILLASTLMIPSLKRILNKA